MNIEPGSNEPLTEIGKAKDRRRIYRITTRDKRILEKYKDVVINNIPSINQERAFYEIKLCNEDLHIKTIQDIRDNEPYIQEIFEALLEKSHTYINWQSGKYTESIFVAKNKTINITIIIDRPLENVMMGHIIFGVEDSS